MNALVALSGGMDSLVTFAIAQKECMFVRPVSFWYGSKHGRWENRAANAICRIYNVTPIKYDLTEVFKVSDSALLQAGEEIPEGHYEAESMKRTVVPGRNTIFAGILLGLAQSLRYQRVYLGIHAGDHHIYPDCRNTWANSMKNVYDHASEMEVALKTPLMHRTKAEIVGLGLQMKVPFNLTRTCYKDQPVACGKCGSCNERLEAFHLNGVNDPIRYEVPNEAIRNKD